MDGRTRPESVADYLARLPASRRRVLQALHKQVHAALPGITERISYGIPGFEYEGRIVCYMMVATNHYSFFPGKYPIVAHAKELAGWATSKGTVRFTAEKPLPARLVKSLVLTRVTEIDAAKKSRIAKKSAAAKRGAVKARAAKPARRATSTKSRASR